MPTNNLPLYPMLFLTMVLLIAALGFNVAAWLEIRKQRKAKQ